MLRTIQTAQDGTVKFLLALSDGRAVETVLVPFNHQDCVCVSTQVGCAMACRFCHTGLQGLTRHLTAAEIVQQYTAVWDWLKVHRPTRARPRVVYMGQGEPMHNFEEVKKSIETLTDQRGIALGIRSVTVSTAGHLPGIERFMELGGVNFALSLHSPFNDERSQLIPINDRWPLEQVFAAIDRLKLRKRQFINCEYLVVRNFNHSARHAKALQALLQGRQAVVNLIPFNPYPGAPWEKPTMEEVEAFKALLVAEGVRTFIRTTKGDEIMAACGQLNTAPERLEAHA